MPCQLARPPPPPPPPHTHTHSSLLSRVSRWRKRQMPCRSCSAMNRHQRGNAALGKTVHGRLAATTQLSASTVPPRRLQETLTARWHRRASRPARLQRVLQRRAGDGPAAIRTQRVRRLGGCRGGVLDDVGWVVCVCGGGGGGGWGGTAAAAVQKGECVQGLGRNSSTSTHEPPSLPRAPTPSPPSSSTTRSQSTCRSRSSSNDQGASASRAVHR